MLCSGFYSPTPSNPALSWYKDLAPRSLQTPALVVVGDKDAVTPLACSHELAALYADARMHVIPGGRHAMPQKANDMAAVQEFLESIPDSPAQLPHPSTANVASTPTPATASTAPTASEAVLRLIYLCTSNVCRSPLAEAIAADVIQSHEGLSRRVQVHRNAPARLPCWRQVLCRTTR